MMGQAAASGRGDGGGGKGGGRGKRRARSLADGGLDGAERAERRELWRELGLDDSDDGESVDGGGGGGQRDGSGERPSDGEQRAPRRFVLVGGEASPTAAEIRGGGLAEAVADRYYGTPASKRGTRSCKPLFERGDRVYAAWWPETDAERASSPEWYPGTVKDYEEVEVDGEDESQLVCTYSVSFDDGDELEGLEQSHLMTREAYFAWIKKEIKPVFEEGDEVYAAWWADDKRTAATPKWYPGVVTKARKGTEKESEFGPTRYYDVRFDDGDNLDAIQDCYIFNKEDYLLTMRAANDNGGGDPKWIGVRNVTDKESPDTWAKLVGWYVATINGEDHPFSFLSDALRAYDAHAISRGGSVKKSDLNLPEEQKSPPKVQRKPKAKVTAPKTSPRIAAAIKSKLRVGSRVYVHWPKDGSNYKATVKNIGSGGTVKVHFDGLKKTSFDDVSAGLIKGFIEEEDRSGAAPKPDPEGNELKSAPEPVRSKSARPKPDKPPVSFGDNVKLLFEMACQSVATQDTEDAPRLEGNSERVLAESNNILDEALGQYKQKYGTKAAKLMSNNKLFEEYKASLSKAIAPELAKPEEQCVSSSGAAVEAPSSSADIPKPSYELVSNQFLEDVAFEACRSANGRYYCPVDGCSKETSTKWYLKRHFRDRHQPSKMAKEPKEVEASESAEPPNAANSDQVAAYLGQLQSDGSEQIGVKVTVACKEVGLEAVVPKGLLKRSNKPVAKQTHSTMEGQHTQEKQEMEVSNDITPETVTFEAFPSANGRYSCPVPGCHGEAANKWNMRRHLQNRHPHDHVNIDGDGVKIVSSGAKTSSAECKVGVTASDGRIGNGLIASPSSNPGAADVPEQGDKTDDVMGATKLLSSNPSVPSKEKASDSAEPLKTAKSGEVAAYLGRLQSDGRKQIRVTVTVASAHVALVQLPAVVPKCLLNQSYKPAAKQARSSSGEQRRAQEEQKEVSALPEGWEEMTEPSTGRKFYVDHAKKATTWERPTRSSSSSSNDGGGKADSGSKSASGGNSEGKASSMVPESKGPALQNEVSFDLELDARLPEARAGPSGSPKQSLQPQNVPTGDLASDFAQYAIRDRILNAMTPQVQAAAKRHPELVEKLMQEKIQSESGQDLAKECASMEEPNSKRLKTAGGVHQPVTNAMTSQVAFAGNNGMAMGMPPNGMDFLAAASHVHDRFPMAPPRPMAFMQTQPWAMNMANQPPMLLQGVLPPTQLAGQWASPGDMFGMQGVSVRGTESLGQHLSEGWGPECGGWWTTKEHEAFMAALQLYGKDWKKVAAWVKTRTAEQTRKYFQMLQKTGGEQEA